jgi:micrococcal nuclease
VAPSGGADPRFGTCREAIAAGGGPYVRGIDVEYGWYRDADGDGVVCE